MQVGCVPVDPHQKTPMPDRPTPDDSRRESVQEAIERLTSIRPAVSGSAEDGKLAVDEAIHKGDQK